MKDNLYLAWQYVCHHRGTTAILITSITLIAYLPAALQVIADNAEEHFRDRAESTPLLVGPRGGDLELVLASVYFDQPCEDVLRMDHFQKIEQQDFGQAIPLHTRFQSRETAIVGTTKDYADLRNLQVANGKMWSRLGECVVGSSAAKKLDIQVGSKIPVDTTTAFLLNDAPLRLREAGILASTETPDDEVIFVDLETTWVIEGLGHGHARSAEHGSPEATLYTDITAENVHSFHFHGNRGNFPITAVIVVPKSQKAETLLMGQYLSPENTAQIARPGQVMDALLGKVFMVRSYIIAIVAAVSLVTLLTLSLVIVLSIRLRRSELVTMSKIGCSRHTIVSILGSQILIILAASFLSATVLTLITDAYGRELVRFFFF